MRLLRVGSAWGRAVGSHLRTVSRPTSIASGRLAVEVADQTWKKELDHLAPFILARLAQVLPADPVAEITFRVTKGSDPLRPAPGCGLRSGALVVDEASRAPWTTTVPEGSLEGVQDRELRTRLSRVMGRYLARAERTAGRL